MTRHMYYSYFSTYCSHLCFYFFFFNDTPTTEIYTLSLHDALPIRPHRKIRAPTRAWLLNIPSRGSAGDRFAVLVQVVVPGTGGFPAQQTFGLLAGDAAGVGPGQRTQFDLVAIIGAEQFGEVLAARVVGAGDVEHLMSG